jgi:hypothetical protein
MQADLPTPGVQNLTEAATLAETPEEAPQPEAAPDSTTPVVKEVGKASTDGMSAAKRRQWQNIALASGAVIVATVAMILVSRNNGHKK